MFHSKVLTSMKTLQNGTQTWKKIIERIEGGRERGKAEGELKRVKREETQTKREKCYEIKQ